MVVDYVRVMTRTLPAMQSLAEKYREALRQDSRLIAGLRDQVDAYERQELDVDRIVTLYETEIERRRQIERLYEAELRRVKWWRRSAIAAASAGILFMIIR